MEKIFWQEVAKVSRRHKPPRVARLEADFDRRTDELHAYRDSPRLPVTLGQLRFSEGLAVRTRRVELAQLELARARHAASPATLPPVAELQQQWASMTIGQRRAAIGEVLDCVFVRSARTMAVERRTHVFLRGRAPVGLPSLGERCDALPPFDAAAFPAQVRLRPVRDWEATRIHTELAEFTAGKDRWPSFPEFQAAGRARLWAQVDRHRGVHEWAEDSVCRTRCGSGAVPGRTTRSAPPSRSLLRARRNGPPGRSSQRPATRSFERSSRPLVGQPDGRQRWA